MNTQRDELAAIIYAADPWANGTAYNAKPYEWEDLDADDKENFTPLADAILAAGFGRPREISTAVELSALPVTSVVLDRYEGAWQFCGTFLWKYANTETRSVMLESAVLLDNYGPLTLVYVGDSL